MKLIIEADLDSPEHQNALGLFMALGALLKALREQMSPTARLQSVLENHPHNGSLVLAESAYDPTNSSDSDYVLTCPINLRVLVSDEAFDTSCHAKKDAEKADVRLHFDHVEVDAREALGLPAKATAASSVLSGLKKAK